MLYLHCQTNNFYIMEKRNFDSNSLTIDIFDYMLVEWLSRRGLYLKFVANLSSVKDNPAGSRTAFRRLIAEVLNAPYLTLSDVFFSAFPFDLTPEGSTFWLNASREWEHFVKSIPHLI